MIRQTCTRALSARNLGARFNPRSTWKANFRRSICYLSYSSRAQVPFVSKFKSLAASSNSFSSCYHNHVALRLNPTNFGLRFFASDLPSHSELTMPALSPSMEKGNIAKWVKKEGDEITSGDVLAEIETDKATMDFEATDDGFLAKILVPDGAKDIPIGQTIAIIVQNKEDVEAFKNYQPEATESKEAPKPQEPVKEEKKETPKETPKEAPSAPPSPPKKPEPGLPEVPGVPPEPLGLPRSGYLSSPLARATASERGVDLSSVKGTGPGGRIVQSDVLSQATAAPAEALSTGVQYTDTPNSQIRKITAERLTMSKQTIPHYYLSIEFNVDKLLSIRKTLNEKANGEYKLSVNDFIIKAAALALKKVPTVNSSWANDSIRTYHNVDINVAVNTEKGLFTPIVRDADKLGLAAINKTVKQLATKAKENKLQPQEFTGGTFTISNLGMFGIQSFAAVINPPQACILAVGGTESKVIVNPDSDSEDQFTVANVMNATLSCDHRVVDGAIGAQWLKEFKSLMEDPITLLL